MRKFFKSFLRKGHDMKPIKPKKHKILCPKCGHPTPIMADDNAVCRGIYVKCKGAHCKEEIEIKINTSEIK